MGKEWYRRPNLGVVTAEEDGWWVRPVQATPHGPYKTLEFAVQALHGEFPKKEAAA